MRVRPAAPPGPGAGSEAAAAHGVRGRRRRSCRRSRSSRSSPSWPTSPRPGTSPSAGPAGRDRRTGAAARPVPLGARHHHPAEEEEDLHVSDGAGRASRSATAELVFKPHPSAPAASGRAALEEEAERLGADLTVLDRAGAGRGALPAAASGAGRRLLLDRPAHRRHALRPPGGPDRHGARCWTGSTPYQNSNRVPLTIVDALLPDLADAEAVRAGRRRPRAGGEELDRAAHARSASRCSRRSTRACARRPRRYLSPAPDRARTWRYFKRRRLTSLGLPGGIPAQLSFLPRNRAVRRAVRRMAWLRRVVS